MASFALSGVRCIECARLLNELKAESQALIEIHRLEAEAAMRDDVQTFESLKDHLLRVRKRRDEVAEALKRHLREHAV